MVTLPLSGDTMLRIAFRVVLFPAPFLPISPIIRLGARENLPFSSVIPGYCLLILWTLNTTSIIFSPRRVYLPYSKQFGIVEQYPEKNLLSSMQFPDVSVLHLLKLLTY